MVSTFFRRIVVRHLVFVGLGYLCLYLWRYLAPGTAPSDLLNPGPPAARFVFFVLLAGGLYFPYCVKKFRPVPHNPIQQYRINLLIATYSVVVALSIAWFFVSSMPHERDVAKWPLIAAIYLYFAWKLIYAVDLPIVEDATGRRMTTWQRAIHEAKKRQTRLPRSVMIWYR